MIDSVLVQLSQVFESTLGLPAPEPDADLIEGGVLDSLALVELLVAIESHFGIQIPPEQLEVERFRTLERLALLVRAAGVVDATDAA